MDNGDGVDCGAALATLGGGVALRSTGGNLGFSGGCNVGIRDALTAGADAVLLVNSDVIVPPDCVGLLMDALRRQKRPGIVGPVVRSRVWPDRVLSAGIDYDTATGRMRIGSKSRGRPEVDSVSGCAMLVHRSVFDRIGLLPEEYFFSFEDIAFCQRPAPRDSTSGSNRAQLCIHEGSGTMGSKPQASLLRGAQSPAARRPDARALGVASAGGASAPSPATTSRTRLRRAAASCPHAWPRSREVSPTISAGAIGEG